LPCEFTGIVDSQISLFVAQIADVHTRKSLISNSTGHYVQLFAEGKKRYECFPQKQVTVGHEYFSTWNFIACSRRIRLSTAETAGRFFWPRFETPLKTEHIVTMVSVAMRN
jgi:hypothetical protein